MKPMRATPSVYSNAPPLIKTGARRLRIQIVLTRRENAAEGKGWRDGREGQRREKDAKRILLAAGVVGNLASCWWWGGDGGQGLQTRVAERGTSEWASRGTTKEVARNEFHAFVAQKQHIRRSWVSVQLVRARLLA